MIALQLVNQAGIPPAQVRAAQHAIVAQANGPLRRAWHTPRVRFERHGWRVFIVRPPGPGLAGGFHSVDTAGLPFSYTMRWRYWTWSIDHEIVEMIVDPYGYRPEVCDPIGNRYYTVDGVRLARFEPPSYFRKRRAAR